MTRVVSGIYDDVVLDTGFFITDEQADLIADWLGSYADALERAWKKNGSQGDERIQKFAKVRSFIKAVKRMREGNEKKGDGDAEHQ